MTRKFRLQNYVGKLQVNCDLSIAAPQSGGWSLDGVRVRLLNVKQDCTSSATPAGFFKCDGRLRNSGTGSIFDSNTIAGNMRNGASGQMYLTATKNGKRYKVSSGQVVLTMAYTTENTVPGICRPPQSIAGDLIIDFVYVAYNVPPGGVPGAMRSSGGCIDNPAKHGECDWFDSNTWCDCTGLASPINIPGFGNLGCDTMLFIAGGLGLFAVLMILRR